MQVYEKYQQLARDAASSGDRIAAENLLQHAEHYFRLMVAAGLRAGENRDGDGGREGFDRRYDGERSDDRSDGYESHQPGVPAHAVAGDVADSEERGAAVPETVDGDQTDRRLRRSRAGANGANGAGRHGDAGNDDGEAAGRPQRRRRMRPPNGDDSAAEGDVDEFDAGEPTQV